MGLESVLIANVSVWKDDAKHILHTINETYNVYANYDEYTEHFYDKQYTLNAVSLNVMYWHDAYPIHQWFLNNSDSNSGVSRTDLLRFINVCRHVLKHSDNAAHILPTDHATFAYDAKFIEDVERTVEQLEMVLVHPAVKTTQFTYRLM